MIFGVPFFFRDCCWFQLYTKLCRSGLPFSTPRKERCEQSLYTEEPCTKKNMEVLTHAERVRKFSMQFLQALFKKEPSFRRVPPG